jgi:outer membrane protein insertion porin family
MVASYLFAQKTNLPELVQIDFEGNSSFSKNELLDVIAIKESPGKISQFFNNFIGIGEEAVYFDSLLVNEDIMRLQSFYFNNGYFNSQISSEYTIDSTDNSASILFIINEGNPCKFNNVYLYGLDSLDERDFKNAKSFIDIDSTGIYSYVKVSGIKENIVTYLKDNGYMFANVDSTIIFIDTLKNFVDTKMFFHLGKKYKISDIIIKKSGNGKKEVDEKLIADIVGITPGETYSKYKIERGQSRLYKTKLFNIATINSIVEDTNKNNVPLKISTEIGNMYEATPEVIMNNEDNRFNLGLGLGFSKKNFLGNARILTLNTSIAAQNIFEFIQNISVNNTEVIGYADIRLILEQPFLLGKNIDTRYELYSTIQKRKNEYNTVARGFKMNLSFELPPYVYLSSLSTEWNYENLGVLYQEGYLIDIFKRVIDQKTNIDSTLIDSIATEIVNNISKTTSSNNTLLSFNIGIHKTNDFAFPTKGYRIQLQLANANFMPYVLSKILNKRLNAPLYYKFLFDFSLFPNIYHSAEDAFGIKFRIGNIVVYKGLETAVPYNQRLTSGGSNSIRGWQSRELVPIFYLGDLDLNSLSPTDLEAIFLDQATPGGLFQFEGSIETRNRLFGNIGGALFIDYGNTWSNIKSFRFDEIAIAAGFGLRYYTDFIPFRIDFGIKMLDPKSNEVFYKRKFWHELLQIHFAIGEAF